MAKSYFVLFIYDCISIMKFIFQSSADSLGRGDLSDELGRENYDWQWSPMSDDQPKEPQVAERRSSDSGLYLDDAIDALEESLQERPRTARLSDGASEADNTYFFPSQTQGQRRKRKNKNKAGRRKKKHAKANIFDDRNDDIDAEEQQQGSDTNKDETERDSKPPFLL